MYDNASELYNEYLKIYFDEYKALAGVKKRNLGNKFDGVNLFLETSNYDVWFENEESTDTTKSGKEFTNLSSMSVLESDEEEVKEGTGLEVLTPNKPLTTILAKICETNISVSVN